MRLPKRGEKGFTLIELLIVVAILGVLAAVVIPNVGRFIGRGEQEAWETEFANIQSATVAMMTDNGLSTLPTAVNATATNNMSQFPDTTAAASKGNDAAGTAYDGSDGMGFILFQHDITADSANTSLVNYVATQYTKGTYRVDELGTVEQVLTGYE
ncbi:MAG: type II secretion system protein [Dehalococcoidales bacterium]